MSTALKVVVSAAFLVLALRGMGLGDVASVLADADLAWGAAACGVLLLSHGLAVVRWQLLLRGQGLGTSLPDAGRLVFVGLFFTNVLPSGFGGDAVRTWVLGRRTGRLGDVAASVLVDRLAAVWALMAVGVVALLALPGGVPDEIAVSLALSAALVLAGSGLLLAPGPMGWLARAARPAPLRRLAASLTGALGGYRGRPGLLGAAFGLSVAGQVCVAAAAWMLAEALGLDVGFALLACTLPVALLATAVPTSINGLGVREAVFRALLVPAGVGAADAVAFSLATVVAGVVVSLPGAVVWAADRHAGGEGLGRAPRVTDGGAVAT